MRASSTTRSTRSRRRGFDSSSQLDLFLLATWTSETSATCCPAISTATPLVTSSPASADGPSPSIMLTGPRSVPCGPAPARANLSARQAAEAGLLTSGTYGRTGPTSFASADLQRSLASRLRQRFASDGSTLFRQTWKEKATPSGLRYWAHTASARRTSDNGCGGWPTPRVGNNGGYGNGDRAMDGANCRLEDTAQIASWPTASARDWKGATHDRWETNARPLNEVARLTNWPTARATDGSKGGGLSNNGQDLVTTAGMVLGPTSNGSPAATAKPGQLNPAFSLWLMGYSTEWARCAAQVTRSCRRLRSNS